MPRRVDPGARDDHRAQVGHQVGEMPVAGGACHFHVELEVGRHRVRVLLDRTLEGVERRLHRGQVLVVAPLGGQAGRLGLQADAQFQHRDHVGDGGEVLAGNPEVARRLGRADEGPDAMAGLDQARGLQPGQGLAHHGAADVEAMHDLGLGRQLVAHRQLAGTDLGLQRTDDFQYQAARAAPCRGRGIRAGRLHRSAWGFHGVHQKTLDSPKVGVDNFSCQTTYD